MYYFISIKNNRFLHTLKYVSKLQQNVMTQSSHAEQFRLLLQVQCDIVNDVDFICKRKYEYGLFSCIVRSPVDNSRLGMKPLPGEAR